MIAASVQCKVSGLREELNNQLVQILNLMTQSTLENEASKLVAKAQAILARMTESQLKIKEEMLELREENLSLRQSIWDNERREGADPLEEINARLKLEEILKTKDEEIMILKGEVSVGHTKPAKPQEDGKDWEMD